MNDELEEALEEAVIRSGYRNIEAKKRYFKRWLRWLISDLDPDITVADFILWLENN